MVYLVKLFCSSAGVRVKGRDAAEDILRFSETRGKVACILVSACDEAVVSNGHSLLPLLGSKGSILRCLYPHPGKTCLGDVAAASWLVICIVFLQF